jgi:predicted acyl esterase
MRKILCVAGAGLVIVTSVAVEVGYLLAPWGLAQTLGMRLAEYAVRIHRNVAMTTADGIRLIADIYRPQ